MQAYYFLEIDSMAAIYFLGFDIAKRSHKKNEICIRNPLRSSPFPFAAAASSSSSWSWLCQQTLLVRLHILLLLLLPKMASCRSLRSLALLPLVTSKRITTHFRCMPLDTLIVVAVVVRARIYSRFRTI